MSQLCEQLYQSVHSPVILLKMEGLCWDQSLKTSSLSPLHESLLYFESVTRDCGKMTKADVCLPDCLRLKQGITRLESGDKAASRIVAPDISADLVSLMTLSRTST